MTLDLSQTALAHTDGNSSGLPWIAGGLLLVGMGIVVFRLMRSERAGRKSSDK